MDRRGQDQKGQDRRGQIRKDRDRTGGQEDRTRTGQNMTEQERQDRI